MPSKALQTFYISLFTLLLSSSLSYFLIDQYVTLILISVVYVAATATSTRGASMGVLQKPLERKSPV